MRADPSFLSLRRAFTLSYESSKSKAFRRHLTMISFTQQPVSERCHRSQYRRFHAFARPRGALVIIALFGLRIALPPPPLAPRIPASALRTWLSRPVSISRRIPERMPRWGMCSPQRWRRTGLFLVPSRRFRSLMIPAVNPPPICSKLSLERRDGIRGSSRPRSRASGMEPRRRGGSSFLFHTNHRQVLVLNFNYRVTCGTGIPPMLL